MSIAGAWYNEFGSLMALTVLTDRPGELHGLYTSQVGDAAGAYPLVGRFEEPEETTSGAPLGWTVTWHNEHRNALSVTSWCGLYMAHTEEILTTWLLTRSTGVSGGWDATVIGHDVFRRGKPTPEEVEHSLRSNRPLSHPKTR